MIPTWTIILVFYITLGHIYIPTGMTSMIIKHHTTLIYSTKFMQPKMVETKKVVIKPHAIMISLPYQGHLNPFIHLAIKLASKGFAVTFVNTQFAHHRMSKSHRHDCSEEFDMFKEVRKSGLDIRYTTISDGFPLEYDRSANLVEFWEYTLCKFPLHVDEFVGNLIRELSSDPSSVPFLVADTFASWSPLIGKKYGLVTVSFWTEPATVFAINYYKDLLGQNGHLLLPENQEFLIDYIPGVKPIHTKDLMSFLKETDMTTIIHKIVFSSFEEIEKIDFVLYNTVQELEPDSSSILSKPDISYAIGPTNFFYNDTKTNNISKSLIFETDCTEWLNSKPLRSVLYISFGSNVLINEQVIKETAKGLQLSQVNFLWVMRSESVQDETNVVPIGFAEDVKDKGLIVSWCNQIDVLSHPAVGGFVTHCGWNSILESMWFGVPIICFPVLYDQPTNRKLVVDDWNIGINLCDGDMVNREEVASKIKTLMNEETSTDGIRNQMIKHKSIMRGALVENGSLEKNFEQFIKDLKDKLYKK